MQLQSAQLRSEDEILNSRGHTRTHCKATTDRLSDSMKVFGNKYSMAKSGNLGASPMVSRPGKSTIA